MIGDSKVRAARTGRPLGWFVAIVSLVATLVIVIPALAAPHTARARDASSRSAEDAVQVPLTTPTAIRTMTPTDTSTPSRTATSTSTASPGATVICGPAWRVEDTPNYGDETIFNILFGVGVVSRNDIWAVGSHDTTFAAQKGARPDGATELTMAQHWDGTQWSIIPTADPLGSSNNNLSDVAALAPNNVWAVGYYGPYPGLRTLVEHWDGTQWSIMPSPNPASGDYIRLNSVSAVSANDIWAVGSVGVDTTNGQTRLTLIEHWDGTQWSIVSSPNPSTAHNGLFGVSARAADDIWAVGYTGDAVLNPLILHSNGSSWSAVQGISAVGRLNAVVALAANNVWAVGYDNASTNSATLTMHFDGAAWSVVSSSSVPDRSNVLSSVAGSGPNDVWAAGNSYYFVGGNIVQRILAEHWDGAAWSIVDVPNPGTNYNALLDLAVPAPGEVWGAGSWSSPPASNRTLVEHLSDPCPTSPTPTATSTATSTSTNTATNTASSTPTITHTATPSATPTLCPITFTDVQPADFYYTAVRYLYCRGVISGYADNSFRPGSNTTRGQLSKVVVLAEEWPLNTSGGPHFTDVPASNPFYVFIETAYNSGIISGYSDGTFRWGNNVTRGQLSKIVVLAEGWSLDTTGGPHFSDVPASDPFYAFVETAYHRTIISGYSDGTFRPGNNATRGQISKIVHSAVTQP